MVINRFGRGHHALSATLSCSTGRGRLPARVGRSLPGASGRLRATAVAVAAPWPSLQLLLAGSVVAGCAPGQAGHSHRSAASWPGLPLSRVAMPGR
jgi:hypothetical protein